MAVPKGKYCWNLERALNCDNRRYLNCEKYKKELKADHNDPDYWSKVLKCPACLKSTVKGGRK